MTLLCVSLCWTDGQMDKWTAARIICRWVRDYKGPYEGMLSVERRVLRVKWPVP